jgi:methionyl-tRNA formyltransferase
MTPSKRVVFFGNERLVSGLKHSSTPVLLGLIERGYDVACVVVKNSDAVSRTARTLEVADIATAHGIPVLSPDRPSDILEQLASYNADFAILAAYGRIIPQRVIDVFSPIGIINIHPSLLPRHRGPTPIETTITAGDDKAGVSIMQLTAGMDEGPTYGQVTYDMQGDEHKFELYERLSDLGAELLFELLPGIIDGSVTAKPQQNTGVTYTTLITKKDGIVDPTTETATEISRKVRAHLGFPKTKVKYKDSDVIITSAKPVGSPTERDFCLPCAVDTTLLIETLIAPNGKTMTGDAYLRGLR